MNEPNKDKRDIITQMVDGIVGRESENPTEREKEIRKHLAGRAWEYFMFLDDDEDEPKEE